MSYHQQQLKKHISNLSELERLVYLRKLVNSSISNLKSKIKSEEAEFNHDIYSSGKRTASNRGGKPTSLTAKAVSNAQMYFNSLEDIYEAIKLIK